MSKFSDEKLMLREHYRKMRDKMTATYKKSLDIEIASRLICSREYADADMLLVYVAKDSEIETRGIISAALANGKQVAVPKCEGEGIMDFYLITSLSELSYGRYGILEPDTEKCRKVTDFENAMCIVPGLSFDPKGNRLGQGGGYYDRFLSSFTGITVGLCYSSFIKWDIPAEQHDIPVSIIVTDRYLRRTA